MKALQRRALMAAGVLAALAASGAATDLQAQRSRNRPPPDAPRMLVPTLRSAEKNVGVQAADAIRSRLSQDFPFKDLWVIPKNDIHSTLEASGYSTTEALTPADAKALATLLRADEYLDATVTKTGGGFRIDSKLVLSRDNALVQPLPSVEGARMDLAAMLLSRELQAARRQLPHEKQCADQAREGNYQEAVAAAKRGIEAYGRATLARICLASVYAQMDAPTDSVIRVAREVLEIDPKNRIALALAAQAYKDASVAARPDTARADSLEQLAIANWLELVGTDPRNVRLATQVVNELAASGNARVAIPLIKRIVAENPGDPDLLRLEYLILLTVRDWKGAIEVGETLYQTDTAAVDTTFFIRLASAYTADSQPQKAAEAVARGVAKFPNNATLHVTHGQMLRSAGQLPAAAQALNRALAIDPKVPRANLQLAQIHIDLNQPDSALVALRRSLESGADDSTFVGQFALSVGNQAYKAASASKQREDFQRAVRFLEFADAALPESQEQLQNQAKFLVGAASLQQGQTAMTEANKDKSCELARQGQESLVRAQINLPRGGSFAPDATSQFLGYLQQLLPVAEQQVKAYCR